MADENHGLDLSADENSRKSRKGSIPRNVDTYLKTSTLNAFVDELRKLADDETPTKIKLKHIGQTALFGGAAAPALKATGNFAKGFVGHSGPAAARVSAGLAEVGKTTRGDVASKAVEGALGGTAIAAASNALTARQREEIAHKKVADIFGAGGAPSGPKISTPSAPTLGVLRGSSNKSQRVGNTPIAAKSGVTRSMSGTALNPRANLGDAMRPKV